MARSRLPLAVSGCGSANSRLACSRVSQFPARGRISDGCDQRVQIPGVRRNGATRFYSDGVALNPALQFIIVRGAPTSCSRGKSNSDGDNSRPKGKRS